MGVQVVSFSIAVVLFIIGVHQTFTYGLQNSYWAFMLSLASFFYYMYKKGKELPKEQDQSKATTKSKTKPRNRKKK